MQILGRAVKFILKSALFLLLALFLVRGIDAWRGPPLQPWHTETPDDANASEIDAMDWKQWMAREDAVMQQVRREVVDNTPESERQPSNRYWPGAPMYAPNLPHDWNRSFTLQPAGPSKGVAVLLHGMTDAPYSLRHIGLLYQASGWDVIAIRLPGHGTVPAGLADARAEDWEAATRLAMREAARRAAGKPIHMVGYSNGAALAVIHALDAAADPALGAPQRIILISPMIGLTPFARFAGVAGWPALLPAMAKAAWLDIIPEFNPFKYNSFPVNGGVQGHRLTVHLNERMQAARTSGRIAKLPPILTFLSVVDSTVDAPAVTTNLYDLLPANGSELVLFDINRNAYVGPLIRARALTARDTFLPSAPRRYATTIVESAGADASQTRHWAAGAAAPETAPLATPYPRNFYSLSHIALPFPPSDGLYGFDPDPADNQGVRLGALALRGERGVLSIGMGTLERASSNPFYDLVNRKIEEVIG